MKAESRHSMRARLAVPIALLFLSAGLWGWINPDVVAEWFDDVISQGDSHSMEVLGLQSEEEWLVVIVDFDENPSAPGLDVNQATSMLTGTNGLATYLEQLSSGKVELNLTIYPTVIRAEHSVDYYGKDSSDSRDTGKDGSDGPATLAVQVATELSEEIDWHNWDLDKDGVVDRFIILHTSPPQEDSGSTSKIWSHFGPLITPVTVADGLTVEHYTMASFRSSNHRGTIIHEALHQHGAIDLYSVHDVVRKDPWNGVGDWDVMASGNWNGNGAVPALPMAATIAQLGVDRHQNLLVTWPESSSCEDISFHIEPQTSGGQPLKIELSSGEYLWAEYRQDSGFDSQLPGEGLLVSIE
ncbi:MAG: M6 family metalloprotease domain-containing protein, partial [Pseudomonadales bacterium]|nr:M6 family metalloprotease domain-containing protein [Pseudomonadales bacterium]